MERNMAEQVKKTTPIYLPLSSIGVKMTGKEYIKFNQQIIKIITEMCSRGKISLKTATEIDIMDNTDPRKQYLQNLVNIVKDKATNEKVQYNLASFGKLILEQRIVIEQAYVDNRMLNWAPIFESLANENFSFDDSTLAELLLKEAKRIRDNDKINGMSK